MGKTILVVDDSTSLRQLVNITLKGAGFDVVEAGNGLEALEKITSTRVHLIISDVNMPKMDGITLVKEVKKLPDYRFVPIILLTTESEEEKKREGQAAGAKAWVTKPFQPAQILGAIQRLLP